jgi:hypothetical protein
MDSVSYMQERFGNTKFPNWQSTFPVDKSVINHYLIKFKTETLIYGVCIKYTN